ncbi:uncharacterized protein LOC127004358 isoform X2 [Eriocheir sinensis]|uniref:uncharacterized protein LOC127004358 isoform X2 n=1 Tax=Eriocheir sinensis TaxID=95602 RepID=UPI0021C66F1E|nr:uncharacterized protein LOC127004358 isoform X2 [Eriocheir sinensis]
MAGPRLPLLLTLTLLLTPLSLTDTSTQTSFGENSTAETVRSAKHNDEGGGDGDGGDGGVEGEVRGQKGVVGSAATALWEKLRPFVDGEYTDDGLQARIRRRLLRVAEEEVSLYSRSAAYTWPDDHSRAANQTKAASAAGDEDNSHDDDVGSDMEYDIPRDVGDEDPCGYDDYCDNDDDVRRSKRDHPQERPQAYDMRGAVLLERVEGMVSLGAWVSLGVHVTQWHGRLILAVLDTSMRVTLHAVSPGTLEVASSPSFPALHSCSFAVVPVDRLLLACISPNGSSVVHGVQQAAGREVAVYKVSEETFGAGKLAVKHHQSVEAKNPVDLELWSRGQENYLLIANAEEAVEAYSPWGEELTNRTTYHTSSLLYHWNDHYFDGLQQRVLPGTNPHAVTHFTIGRQHFVAMANFQNNKGQHNVDSYVFQYSLEEEHFVLFQRLATRGARHFASFTLGRHPFADTFLVVANFCEDNIGGACDTFTRSSIYRYAQRKFVLFQEVATAYAVQWQAVQVEDTVLLAVAQLVEGVKLFQYDGWRFVAAPVQHYEGRFGPGVTGLAAARWNGTYVLAVSNREPENSPAQSPDVFNLTFRENTWLQKVHLEHHAWCEAAREEVARVGDLSSLIQQVHSAPTNGQPHVFTQYSIIRGHLTVQRNSSVTQVFERRTGSRMPVMLDSLTQTLVAMEQEVQRAATRLSHAISLTSPYPWPAELHLAHLSAGWASVEHVEALQLNQRRVSFEDAVTLDEAGAQHLAGLSLAHVEIQAPARITMLAGVPFSSYVTLSGRHTLHGQVTILANVSAAGLLALSVDGVHITRKSVLTANEYQYLKGLLTCQHLSVDSMEVITINSIPLSPLLSTLVFRDGRHTVSGLVRVRGDLAYYGNLKINLTTHLDLENPLRTDYTGLQVITSDHQAGGLATQVMAVEGRVNGVRVPADVFLNGRQYSYNVPRAAFRNVRADLLSVTRALNSLTVSEGRLDVLLLSGDQQVTAHKMLSSLHVLRSDSPDVGTRRRRWSSESCGSSKANKPKTPKDRSEALLLSLKGVAAARHLLSYLVKAPQGILLVPGHSLHFFKALTQNVACAISSLEDDSCFKLYNILQEVEWINSTTQDGTLLTRKTVLEIISNVKRYIVKEERELKKIRLTSNDLLKIRDVTGRNTPTRQDIVILSSLISVARNHELHHLPPDILFNNCVLVCPEIRENMAVDKNLQKTCTPSITPIFKALRSMSQYSSIIRRMWHLSTRHFGMLETGVIHHLLGRLLQTVRMHKQLRKQIYAAAVCGISPEGGKQSLQVLIKYRQEVHREALNLFVSRTKREAPVANDELAETTNSPSTTESLSTGDNSTASPSPSSFTGNLTTSTEDQTISLPSTTQTTTISNEDSTTFPSSTVNGPVISSEESTFFPFTTATNLTISGEDSSTSSFINEDTTISFEDLTEAPPSTVLLTGSNLTFTPHPPSTTEDVTIFSDSSTTSPSFTTKDSNISSEISTIPSSTPEDSTIFSEISTISSSTPEDSTISSEISTTSSSTPENSTISSEISTTSSSNTEDSTISSEISITSSSNPDDSTIFSEISTTSFFPLEDSTISSEISVTSSSTPEDSTIFSEISTTSFFPPEDSTISSEISITSSSTPEDSTIFSEISTTSFFPPEDSTISSEISATSSSTTEDSTIFSEISTTSSSNTEDSSISSEISITSSSNPEDSTIFSEISTTSFFPPEDSTISSEISITSSSPSEDSTIFSEISTTSFFPPEDSTISSEISATSSSTTEDSSISSEISINSSSNPEDSTIFSEISTTSFFPPEDSTISSEISATSSSTTEDSTIFSEISATLFSTTEDSTISSEISTVSSSATVDSTISSEISTASSSTNEDSTIASEISTASSSTPEDSTISREISTTLFFTSEDSIISSEISTASFSSTEDSTKISGEILTSLSSTTEDNSTFSEEPSVSSSISHRPTTYSENSTTPVSITEDLTATITVREDPIPSLTFATADPATSPTSTTEDSTTSLTSSLHYATPSTSLVPLEEILARSFGSFSSGSEGETINEDSSADINNFFNALLNLTTTLHTEMATPSTSTSEEPVDEDNLGGIFDAIKNLATTTPAEETTLVTTDSSESTPNEDENGGLDDINGSENQTTTRPAEVTTLETDVSEGTMVGDSNGDSLLGAIKDLATTGSSEVQTHKTDDFIEDTTHLTTDTTENTTKVTTDPVRDTTPCIDCPVLESNSSVDTDNNILNYTTSSNATPCFECNEVTTLETDVSEGTLVGGSNGDSLLGAIKDLATTDASVDESATTVQRLLTTSEEDTTTETAVDGSTQSITTNTFEEGSHNVTTETSTAHSSSGGETTHSTKEAATPTLVSQDITCAIITESPPTDPEEPLEVMIKFSDENSAMEVRRSVTKADPMLVPLSISLNYDNCSSLSLALLQDSDHLMYLYPRLQMTSHYLFTVLQSQGNVDSTETSEYDVGLEGSMFDGFGFIIDTLKKFVLDPIKFLETLDSERLQSDFEFLDFVFSFASSSHYHYWSDRLRYRALYLERLLDVGITIVDKLKKCFEFLSPVSTSVTETTTVYFVDPEEMPEIMHDLERQLVSNEELIESLTILLNFTRDVQAFNPYLNPRCPSPHTIDHEFVAYAIEAARETLDMILADELKFVSEYNSSVLANQLLQLRDAMQLCLMADKLSPEIEAYLSLLYNKNGSPMARDSEKLLSVRIYYLLRATHGLVDYMNVITEEHTIKHEVSSYPPNVVPLTDWNWDGLWLAGRLEGYSISQLLEDAKLHPTLQKEYTAYFDPAFSSYSSFIAEHREKVRHLVFRAGLGTVSVQEHGVMRVVQHALWLTTTPATSLTFAAPVTVVGSVTASVINGTPADAFVTLGGQHVLPQPFVFTGSVTAAAHVLLRGEVSGVDLALLSRSVAVTSPVASQKLLQPVTFARVSAASVVFAHGRVRDVPLEDLVRLDRPAAITGIKTFTELTVRLGGTRASNLIAQFISGVNVTDLFFNSLTTNPGGPQVVTGALHLRHLVVRRNVTTHRLVYLDPLGTPHTLNLPSLASRMVPLHGDTILTGSLNFTGVVYVSALLFRDSLDRVSAAQFRDGWLLRAGDQDILGPVSFLNITIYKATVLHGATLQGVDLTRLFGATFLTTQPVTLHATFAFRGLVWAAWTMVDGLVQGWDLGTHAVLQHSSGVVFTAAKTFLGNMHVSGAITSGSRADHCPYFPIKNFTIQGQVLANNALNAGSAVMSSHEVTAEAATQYWLADTSAKVAVSTLRVVKLNYSTATKVNGEDLQDLRSDLLQKYCDTGEVQRVVGNYTFSSLEVDALYTPAINSSFINGEPGNSLQQVLFSGGTQVFTGHPTFASLHSEGSVATSEAVNNGLKGSQLCRHSQRCVVRSPKNFLQDLIILRNLTVLENSLVQGVDVSRALQSWVPQDSCGHVPGLTTITGNLIVASIPSVISVGGLVDGVEFTSRHVMTRTGRQTLTKTFLVNQPHGVALESLAGLTALDGLFNGYSLSDAWRRAFLSNASVVVKAPVVFKEIVVFKDAISLQTQDPAPLPNFGDFKHFFGDFSRLHSLSVLSERAQLGRVRENWGWRVVQELDPHLERLLPLTMGAAAPRPLTTAPLSPNHHLALLSGSGSVPVLQRDPHADRYAHSGVVLAGRCTTGLVSYASEGRNFLVTTHACRDDHTTDVTTSAIPDPETDENLHVWEATPQGAVLRTVLGVPGAVDIQVVWPEDDGNVCLVVVEARGTDVVVLCERQAGVFAEHQRLNLTKPTKVSAAIHTPPVGSSGLTLAVADPGRTALKGGGISLFQYDKERREFRLLQEEFLEDVVFVEMVSRGTDLLLVAVTEGHRAGLRAGRVCIYRVDWYSLDGLTPLGHRGRLVKSATPSPRVARLPLTPQLFPVQEVPIEAPSEARFLAGPSGGLYLYVISHSGLVTWFSQKGIQMFQKEGEMRVLRRLTLEVWAMAGGEWAPRMSLAGGRCPRGSHEAPNLPTLVLEMMFRGGNATVTTP